MRALNAEGGASEFSDELRVRCGGGGGGSHPPPRLVPQLLSVGETSLSIEWGVNARGGVCARGPFLVELAEEIRGGAIEGGGSVEEWMLVYEGAAAACEITRRES